MAATTIAGYEVPNPPFKADLCLVYEAWKDGTRFFLKLYRYQADQPVTAARHHAAQERIRRVLDGLGNISEDILEHGLLEGWESDDSFRPDVYYQVKPWVESRNLTQQLETENETIGALLSSGRPEDGGRARELLAGRLELCVRLVGLLKQCHRERLVHQDLKPAQFLMVPHAASPGGARPVIADFDWSFFEGEAPLRNVFTLLYMSHEHATERPRGCPSDVFTMALILFEALSLGGNPLYTLEEEGDGLEPAQIASFVRRAKMARSLRALYTETFGDDADAAGLERLDDVLRRCLLADAAARPSAQELWATLRDLSLFRDAAPVPSPEPTAPVEAPVPAGFAKPWFRLRAEGDDQEAWTVRPGQTRFDRGVARTQFPMVADDDGNPFHRYLDKRPPVPLLEFRLDEAVGWQVHVPEEASNGAVLRPKSGAEEPLTSDYRGVQPGDRLVLFSRRRMTTVESCTLVVHES